MGVCSNFLSADSGGGDLAARFADRRDDSHVLQCPPQLPDRACTPSSVLMTAGDINSCKGFLVDVVLFGEESGAGVACMIVPIAS